MLPANNDYRVPLISPLQLIIELSIIIFATIYATSSYINFDPTQRLIGFEMEYQGANHYLAAETLRTQGYVPLWQPYTSTGEPIIDGLYSDLLNPFAIGPSYLFGGNTGLKLGIVVAALIAGLGGWALGRVLGFGSLARVILALLCLGKGNLYSALAIGGYYQFVFTEAFFPWVATGMIGLFWLPKRRWPIVLTAISITLLFFSGSIWFMLPVLLMLITIVVAHMVVVFIRQRLDGNIRSKEKIWKIPFLDFIGLRRLTYAAILTVLLSSALLLPTVGNYNYLPKQKLQGDTFLDIATSIDQFIEPNIAKHAELFEVVRTEAFNFTLPLWFGAILLVLTIPLLIFYRQAPPKLWRIYLVGWVMVVFFVLWTAGLNPVIGFLNNISPVFNQFKHQWRALSMSAFWLSVVIAIHVNGLWITFSRSDAWQTRLASRSWARFLRAGWVRQLISVALILISGVASFQVVHGWKTIEPLESLTNLESSCVTWLRQTNPNAFLSIWTGHYIHIWDYLDNQVRHWTLGTDFYPASALKPTLLTDETLLQTPTQYALVYGGELDYALIQGFKNDPPNTVNNDNKDNHCPLGLLMRNPTAFSYAFTAPLDAMQMDANIIPVNVTTPISSSNYIHGADYIGLVVDSDPNRALVVTTQDTAYPGWQVQINGKTAKLESVGGQIGVILPPGQGQNQILFQYLPPLWLLGSKITLLGCLLCIAFLLRIERLIPKSIAERVQAYKVNARAMATAQAVRTWQKTAVFLTDDHAFDPEKNDLPVVSLLLSAGAQKELPAPKRPIEVLIESVDETGDPPDQV